VRQVARAEARVRIQAVDFNQDVDLIAVDASGEEVTGVNLTPRSVRVTIQVNPTLATKTVPVNPVVTGAPATHWSVSSVVVAPVLVTIEGSPALLESIASVDTEPVSVSGLAKDLTTSVGLQLPGATTALGVSAVKVTIDLVQDTGSRSFEIGLQLRNAGSDTTYDIAVDRVIATVAGAISDLDALDPTTLVANLNVIGLDPGTHRVRATLSLPTGLDLVSISPQEVSVTVTPRPTPTPEPSASPSNSPAPEPSATPTPAP
jgi:YbbR domain-containing protein